MFIFPFRFAPGGLTLGSAGLKEGKKAPGERLPALTPVPDGVEFGKISLTDQDNSPKTRTAASSSRNAVSISSSATSKIPDPQTLADKGGNKGMFSDF
jgi:hypothetical protein